MKYPPKFQLSVIAKCKMEEKIFIKINMLTIRHSDMTIAIDPTFRFARTVLNKSARSNNK